MINEYQIRVQPHQAANEQSIIRYIAQSKGLDARTIKAVRVLKKSIDARQRTIFINLTIRVFINEEPPADEFISREYGNVENCRKVIVVGAGPAGLFAALKLIELRLRPIVVERGKDVRTRKLDVAAISREHKVNPESNYCFGEGGAGAYSDGKLYTRSKKRGNIEGVLNVFCQHGASPTILSDAHPHIGTDKLPRVIENMRNRIIECGGEVHFETRMEEILLSGGKVCGIRTDKGEILADAVILATGHSARDVYRTLHEKNIIIEAKGIAVGVRLEHPSELIDRIQYHNPAGRGKYLPAAEYSYTTQVEERGVYSFCMCPGGEVVAAASEEETVVVNGMSHRARDMENSNSAVAVSVFPEDYEPYEGSPVLGAIEFQRRIERAAYVAGGRNYDVPVMTVGDFLGGTSPQNLKNPTRVRPSYRGGEHFRVAPLSQVLPPYVLSSLEEGLRAFDKKLPGFAMPEAVLSGAETRTSAPVRMPRGEDFCALGHPGIYPCGEGAGYAGGITSAATDGLKVAEAIIARYCV